MKKSMKKLLKRLDKIEDRLVALAQWLELIRPHDLKPARKKSHQ